MDVCGSDRQTGKVMVYCIYNVHTPPPPPPPSRLKRFYKKIGRIFQVSIKIFGVLKELSFFF